MHDYPLWNNQYNQCVFSSKNIAIERQEYCSNDAGYIQ